MLTVKKRKILLLTIGTIFSVFFSFSFFALSFSSALAQGLTSPDVSGMGLSTKPLETVILNIINAALAFVGIIALAIFIYGGYVWMTSRGDAKKIAQAKKILISAVIGLVIILLAWAIVQFLINGLSGNNNNNNNNNNPPSPPMASYAFRVVNYSPQGNNIAICRPVIATFSANLDCAAATAAPAPSPTVHLRLECTIGGDPVCAVAGLGTCQGGLRKFCNQDVSMSKACAGSDFNFKPTNELQKNASYRVTIDGGASGVKSASNINCSTNPCKEWDFSTGSLSDNVPPKVLSVSPKDGATNVCLLKPVGVVFSEEMDPIAAKSAGAFSSNPSASFSASMPVYDILRESPVASYASNTNYLPLLNANVITDMCGNKLDGNANGTAEGSPTDDYAPPPVGTAPDWSFATGTTVQCVPKITNINPASSYYDNLGTNEDRIVISGENFDSIPDTVYFQANLPVTTLSSAACFNATFDSTPNACLLAADWTDTQITIKTPASSGDSNGAISGPIKINVGQFSCAGQKTCKAGAAQGQQCASDAQCPNSTCGLAGSCSGGSNSGNGCDADAECPGLGSNPVNLTVNSPHINGVSPAVGGPGSWITISGFQFGTVPGTVKLQNPFNGAWVVANLPCASSWNDNYVIVEIPTDFPTSGAVLAQVIAAGGDNIKGTADDRHSNINNDFALNAAAPGPGICAINPSCGETGSTVSIDGKRFGATADKVLFNSTPASAIAGWTDANIANATVPALSDGSYQVKVNVGGIDSNGLSFSIPCAGRPSIALSNACPGSSPNPQPDSIDNCSNISTISARFTQDMTDGDLTNSANVSLWKCNTGATFGGSASCTVNTAGALSIQIISPTADEVKFTPAVSLTPDTWYEFRISGNVRSASGLTMGTAKAYPFHIRDNTALCAVDAIDVVPNNWTMNISATRNYTANTLNTATCNTLSPPAAGWTWNPTSSTVATVTGSTNNTDTATGVGSGTENIAATLNVSGTPYMDTAQLTVKNGGSSSVSGGAVCGNNIIETGEQCDDGNATAGDGCSAACKTEPAIVSVKPAAGAANVCKNAATEIIFSTIMSGNSLTTGNIRLLDASSNPVAGKISYKNIDSADADSLPDQTVVTFYPSAVLSDSTVYAIEAIGGASGVKNSFGDQLLSSCGGGMVWNGTDRCTSGFTTGTEICKIAKVTITFNKDFNPDSSVQSIQSYGGPDLFTCAGKNDCPDDFDLATAQNQHYAIANAEDATGLSLSGVAFSWSKSADAPFSIEDPGNQFTNIQADPKSGLGALTVKADGGVAGIMSASTNITVAPCDNPWQPTGTYPYRDDIASSPANPTNFSLWYCRDAGGPGTADDLPALNVIKKDGAGELIKEMFFYDANNPNDAVGLRVYANTNHWSPKNWYEKRAPNRQGAPNSTTVDGWEGITVGRTVYVNAANHIGSAPPAMNIYLMSHSDKISANLQNIYNQLIANWKFAITEYDDGTDGTAKDAPQNHLRKLQRDTKRLTDLYDAAVDLYEYKIGKGKYPQLSSGTYLNGHSASVWPSWDGTLSEEVGAPMPHDPISQMSSLVGWWKLDEGSGNTASDSGVYGLNGSLQGGVDATGWRSGASCKYGNCLEFDGQDGKNQDVTIPSLAGKYSNKITVSAWIKNRQMRATIHPNNPWDDIVAGDCDDFVFAVIGDDKLTFQAQCGFGPTDGSGAPNGLVMSNRKIRDDKWHYVAATYDGAVMKLYIDGVFDASASSAGSFKAGPLRIGHTAHNNREYFDGSIDEVRIWNTPLTDKEINNLFKSNAARFGSSKDSGWDQTKNAFSCSAGNDFDTHIYHYTQEINATQFSIYAALEYVGGDGATWRQKDPSFGAPNDQPYNPCNGVGSSSCSCYNYRQQEVIATDLGLCGNGQWDSSLGELCDGTAPSPNGLRGKICPTGKCDVASSNAGAVCASNLDCPSGTCVADAPTCDASCQPFCAGGTATKAVCGNGKIESPVENCECSDFNNPATCNTSKGIMSEYYCYNGGANGNDLDAAAISVGEIDDTFKNTVTCSPVNCNLSCSGGIPVRAELNNGFLEPWIGEQCDAKKGYCSASGAPCVKDSDCGGGSCVALGNGGYYCDDNSAVKCNNNGVRSCTSGTLTSCIGGSAEWLQCGGNNFPASPYNYLQTDLYGWCFR